MTDENKLSLKAARGAVTTKLKRFAARDDSQESGESRDPWGKGANGPWDKVITTSGRDPSEFKSSTLSFSARMAAQRAERAEREERGFRGERGGYRSFERSERSERFERGERSGFRSSERSERGGRGERGGYRSFERSERLERSKQRHGAFAPQGKGYGELRQVIDVTKTFETSVPLGRMVDLTISEVTDKGVFVNAAEHGALFVPRSQVPEGLGEGASLRVCLYKDGPRVLATARRPIIELGQVGNLRVNSINNGTAYLDLGIPKELVFPVAQQRVALRVGDTAMVYVAIDSMGRLFATQRFNDYIRARANEGEFSLNQKVKVVPLARTPLGFRVVINDQVYGLIYKDEPHVKLTMGKRYEGYIKVARPDGRLDVSLQEVGLSGIEHAALDILKALYYSKGHFAFNDKSDPELIEDYLHMSKGKFKKALGMLYKQRLVVIGDGDITITDAGRAKMHNELGAAKPTGTETAAESAGADEVAADLAADMAADMAPSAIPDELVGAGDSVAEDLLHSHHSSAREAAHAAALQVSDDKLSERSKERLAQLVADAVDTGEGEAEAAD
ncbi:MAG TPA: hypothetical protein H9898_03735 [Candidatus Anaerobiospirillum stercoravium]|nr:hypothetical protein [Candidatus Anaerobiospirillum stercoravium]